MSSDAPTAPSRDELCSLYLDALPYEPYPVQEEALLAWFTSPEGVLVCAPTGMGKTLIAEAALFEALHTGRTAYYTTPLIALCEQKFREMQDAAERWGFSRDDVGLVTGNRRVNPEAKCLVVVAEILLNRLLHREAFDFSGVEAVVMDEFHSFNDPERGVVWELTLALLPGHVRLLLLSATVGNATEFLLWLRNSHGRKLQLIQSTQRKVPLHFEWVGERLLNEQLERMSEGDEESHRTPSLLFCFNREECWSLAEQLKGKSLLREGQQKALAARLDEWDWKQGAGPKLRQLLLRGVGVHHAGMLPKYRRRVEELFQEKLLSVCVCTETLAAGINLPARSVVLTSLMKGPPGKKKLVDPSSAHQMFGRAGRPQFDRVGYVFALAHEDDVKIAHWKRKYDEIPEDTKDPNLIRAKKRIKKKMPTRRSGEQYWTEEQFQKLIAAPPAKLASRGELPWRLLVYLLRISPEVDRLREFVDQRLLDPKRKEQGRGQLDRMLLTLWDAGDVDLDPPPPRKRLERSLPPPPTTGATSSESATTADESDQFGTGLIPDDNAAEPSKPSPFSGERAPPEGWSATGPPEHDAEDPPQGTLGALLQEALETGTAQSSDNAAETPDETAKSSERSPTDDADDIYTPHRAYVNEQSERLLHFRSVNPLYGVFLVEHFGLADEHERIQALESVLEMSRSLLRQVRVPPPDVLPPGPLAREYLDAELISRGLVTPQELNPAEHEDERPGMFRERRFAIPLAEKLLMLFRSEYPDVRDVRITPVWVVGDLLQFSGDFEKYVRGRDLVKQEGLIFRHLLRMVLLCGEFAQLTPPHVESGEWSDWLNGLSDELTRSCRAIDPESTDKTLESMQAPDILAAEKLELELESSSRS